jgi:hypothetical protein
MEGYGDSREMVITGWGKVIITVYKRSDYIGL